MVFSFFRKKDQDDARGPASKMRTDAGAVTPATPAGTTGKAAEQSAPSPATKPDSQNGYDLSDLTIEVEVGSESLTPSEEQAVMLHANNQPDAAIAVLEAEIPQIKGKRRLESWLMLFELYQQTGKRQLFDALALDYVLEFETSPPIWDASSNQPPAAASKNAATSNYHAFAEKLTAETIGGEINRFMAALASTPVLRADFSKVQDIDTLGAAELLVGCQQAKKRKVSLQVLGSQHIAQLLQSRIEVGRRMPAEAPFWLLLIEIYQALGLQEEFENLAVDYAITYEVSPPSWDARHAPRTASQVAADEAKAKAELDASQPAPQDGLALSGDISAKQGDALDTIRAHAQSHPQVIINLRQVRRIDFESAGLLLNLFMSIQDKPVRIIQANEMVYGLLRLMGITDLVNVSRRKGN
ncbi:hypothetical protein [Chitinilyticum aquatile]|uniref:hypothetical protein n=1 Tax=Chitinilyticum aquatile TaxID=362520 RepID=UPI0003F5FEEA|nr:hypothetical protein [Chitinilyticum aquatile]